jgi:5,10-methylenetetrahydromethanopterin reductase
MEAWTLLPVIHPADVARMAREAEASGWDGVAFADTQTLGPDPYVLLGAAALATERLQLTTLTTNPYTREPAITASAMATLQDLSNGRAVLGIGRGDSSLAFLGMAPVSVDDFVRALTRLRAYLGAEDPLVEPRRLAAGPASMETLALGAHPVGGGLKWMDGSQPAVPIDVVASGPRVIQAVAPIVDRITFAVGADPERLSWAIGLARSAREQAGADPDELSFGAVLNVAVHPDISVARDIAAGMIAGVARFSAMQTSRAAGPVPEDSRAVFASLRTSYDMNQHGGAKSPQGSLVTEAFGDYFAVLGAPDKCIGRLNDIVATGIERLMLPTAGLRLPPRDDTPDEALASALLVEEVLPAVRAAQQDPPR